MDSVMEIRNYIWDLDGTLLDSYGVIVSSLQDTVRNMGVSDSAERILRAVKLESVSAYLREVSERAGADYDSLYQAYRRVSHDRAAEIRLIPGAMETLRELQARGAIHDVYTHRGASTDGILKRLGIAEFFRETVTWEAGFPPKPSGAGVRYLVEKYQLTPAHTAYIGDRTLDVGCARDAGVKAILYRPADSCVMPTGEEDRVIARLEQLVQSDP